MGNRASAERACKDPNPIIDGRKANVNLAILGAKPRGNITPGEDTRATYVVHIRSLNFGVYESRYNRQPHESFNISIYYGLTSNDLAQVRNLSQIIANVDIANQFRHLRSSACSCAEARSAQTRRK